MLRSLTTLAAALMLCAAPSPADVVIYKKGSKIHIAGIKKNIGKVAITVDNVENFLEQSTGVVVRDGYDSVALKKSAKATKAQMIPVSSVLRVLYSTEPADLLDGFDSMATGSWGPAISSFARVIRDKQARAVYRYEAWYRVGICYYLAGKRKTAIAHFVKWPAKNSKYTPEVHRLLAELYTAAQAYDKAIAEYQKIGALENIPANWGYRAKLGEVKVAIAQKKYDAAEKAARAIAVQIGGDESLHDASALATGLQAQAILKSAKAERLDEARSLLEKAVGQPGKSNTTSAFLYTTLGHVIYAQKDADGARYAYLRCVTLYPGERGHVAVALRNAGQCFLDLAGKAEQDGKKEESNELFLKGMRLISECGRNYRGDPEARAAGKIWRQNKARYEELTGEKK